MQQRTPKEIEKIKNEANRLISDGKVISKTDSERILNMIKEMHEDFKTEISTDKTQREKDYTNAIAKRKSYLEYADNIEYNLLFTEKLYLYLKDFVMSKLTYNRELNIYGIDVCEEFFKKFDKSKTTNKSEIDENLAKVEYIRDILFFTFPLKSSTIYKISYLTSMFENKGINEKSYMMRQLYQIIADVSNLVEYFNILNEELEQVFINWRNGFMKYDNEELETSK